MTRLPDPTLEELARQAVAGDRDAVERLVRALQGDVFRLAVRMLWVRADAEDATQEILVRAITRLSQFDFRSRLTTWVYRIAVHHLLDVRSTPYERRKLDFEQFADDLGDGLCDDGPAEGERSILTEEVKVGCTMAMLQCLDRPLRVAYVLGEVLELSADDAAEALDLDPAAFRKRLERARARIEAFMRAYCGLISDAASCRCHRRVQAAVRLGRASASAPQHARAASSFVEARDAVRRLEQARWALEAHRTSHPRDADVDFARRVVSAL